MQYNGIYIAKKPGATFQDVIVITSTGGSTGFQMVGYNTGYKSITHADLARNYTQLRAHRAKTLYPEFFAALSN